MMIQEPQIKNLKKMNKQINIYRFIGFIGFSILFYACKTTAPYQAPTVSVPGQYHGANNADVAVDSTANIADIPWEAFFKDSTLKNFIQKGLEENFDLQLAINRIDIADAALKQAKLLNLPTLGLGVTGEYNRPSENTMNGQNIEAATGDKYMENYQVGASLAWEADIWGKIRGQKKVALQQYLQTSEAKRVVQTKLIADIAIGYYNLLVLDQQLQIATSSLLLADSTLKLTQLLKDAGKVNILSVQQTEAQRHTVALLIPELQDNITAQENALQVLMGQQPGHIKRSATLLDLKAPEMLSVGVPASVVGHRPDVRSAEQNVRIAFEKIGIAKARMYPSLKITATGGVEALKASQWFNIPGSLFGIAAGSVFQPIFQHGALKKDLKVARLQEDAAVIEFRQSVLNAVSEVASSLVHFDKLKERAEISNLQVRTLNNAIVNASLLYKSGLANYLEVISAQNNALQAKLNLAFIHGQELSSTVDIYRSLGGGWQ